MLVPAVGTIISYGRIRATLRPKSSNQLYPPLISSSRRIQEEVPPPVVAPSVQLNATQPNKTSASPALPSSTDSKPKSNIEYHDLPPPIPLLPLVGWPLGSDWPTIKTDSEKLSKVEVIVADEATTTRIIESFQGRKGLATNGLAGTIENPLVGVMRMSAASAYEKEKVVKRSMQEVAEELVQAAREGGVEVGKSVVIMMFFHVESLNEDGGIFRRSFTIPSHNQIQVLLTILSYLSTIIFSGICALTSDLATCVSLCQPNPALRTTFKTDYLKRTDAAQDSYLQPSARLIFVQPARISKGNTTVLILRTDVGNFQRACAFQLPIVSPTKNVMKSAAGVMSKSGLDGPAVRSEVEKIIKAEEEVEQKIAEWEWEARNDTEEVSQLIAESLFAAGKSRAGISLIAVQPGLLRFRKAGRRTKTPSSSQSKESIPNIFVKGVQSSSTWKVDAVTREALKWDHENLDKFAVFDFSPSIPKSLLPPQPGNATSPPATTISIFSSSSPSSTADDSQPFSSLSQALGALQNQSPGLQSSSIMPSILKSQDEAKKTKKSRKHAGEYSCGFCGSSFDAITREPGLQEGVGKSRYTSSMDVDGVKVAKEGAALVKLCPSCAIEEHNIREGFLPAAQELIKKAVRIALSSEIEPSPEFAQDCFDDVRKMFKFYDEPKACPKCGDSFAVASSFSDHARKAHPAHESRVALFDDQNTRRHQIRLRKNQTWVCPFDGCVKTYDKDDTAKLKIHFTAHYLSASEKGKTKPKKTADFPETSNPAAAKKPKRKMMVPDSDNDSDDQASSPQQPDGKKQKSKK